MKYCSHCGAEMEENATFCPTCGANTNASAKPDDQPSFGFAVLGFFIPLVGLILWLVWKQEKPLRAKSCGKGALIGVIVNIVFSILSSLFMGSLVASILASSGELFFMLH